MISFDLVQQVKHYFLLKIKKSELKSKQNSSKENIDFCTYMFFLQTLNYDLCFFLDTLKSLVSFILF